MTTGHPGISETHNFPPVGGAMEISPDRSIRSYSEIAQRALLSWRSRFKLHLKCTDEQFEDLKDWLKGKAIPDDVFDQTIVRVPQDTPIIVVSQEPLNGITPSDLEDGLSGFRTRFQKPDNPSSDPIIVKEVLAPSIAVTDTVPDPKDVGDATGATAADLLDRMTETTTDLTRRSDAPVN